MFSSMVEPRDTIKISAEWSVEMFTLCELKKFSDVLNALVNGYCPNDDSLLEKLRTWLETSLNDAGIRANYTKQPSGVTRNPLSQPLSGTSIPPW